MYWQKLCVRIQSRLLHENIALTPASYSDHVKELNNVRPKQPFFFLKPTSSIVLPGQGPVIRPKGVNLHYEVELGFVMGRDVRDLDPTDEKGAFDAIDCKSIAP